MISNAPWTKSKGSGLYRYNPTGQYFAPVHFRGKLYRKKLDTEDYELAKRKLADFRRDLERTESTKGNTSFARLLDCYVHTLGGSDSTKEKKQAVIEKLKQTWFGIDTLPARTIKHSQVKSWMEKHYGEKSASHYNSALTAVRDAFELAVNDKIIVESPAKDLKYEKRAKPIRPTPTFEQFKQIVADIRAQRFNPEAEQIGDFIEFLGMAGLGQAETAAIKRSNVDLDADASSFTATRPSPVLRSRPTCNCGHWLRSYERVRRTMNGCFRSTNRVRRCVMLASVSAFPLHAPITPANVHHPWN